MNDNTLYKYEVNNYNNTNSNIPASIDLFREDTIENLDESSQMCIESFFFNSGNIPIFIPKIQSEAEYNSIISSDPLYNLPTAFTSGYVKGKTTNLWVGVDNSTLKLHVPIIWIPENNKYEDDFVAMSNYDRSSILNCRYYWAHNTAHILTLISNAFRMILQQMNPLYDIYIIFQNNNLCMFFNSTLLAGMDTVNFVFSINNELARILPFPSVEDDVRSNFRNIIIESKYLTEVQFGSVSMPYFVLTTFKTPQIIPFCKIVLLSKNAILRELKASSNNDTNLKKTVNEVASFNAIAVSNPDTIYNHIFYADNYLAKWINFYNLMQEYPHQISFEFKLQTPDGYMIPFEIQPDGIISVKYTIRV